MIFWSHEIAFPSEIRKTVHLLDPLRNLARHMKTKWVGPWLLAAMCLAGLGACASQTASGPGVYRDHYLSLRYPEGWKVRSALGLVSVESSVLESGILTITRDKALHARTLTDYATRASKAAAGGFLGMGRAIPGSSRLSEGEDAHGPVVRETVQLEAFGKKMSYYREFRRREAGAWVFYLLNQVDEEDRPHTKPLFDEILRSLEFTEASPR